MELLDGEVEDLNEDGVLTIRARLDNLDRFVMCGYKEARIMLKDSRTITAEQRKKIYALLGEIAEWMGDFPEIVKKTMKWEFRLRRLERMAEDFSLADCSVEMASEFIDFLVEMIIAWEVPLKQPLIDLCEDISTYGYTCLKYKKCAVCGRPAELHHVDAVGMGNDRREIAHEGKKALSLCRKHHTEIHTLGAADFLERYHLEPVWLNSELCNIYKIKSKKEKK